MRQILISSIAAVALAFPGRGYAQHLDGSLNGPAAASGAAPLMLGHTLPVRVSWTRRDIALASAFTTVLLMDAGQTRGLARAGWDGFHEANPLLGRSPSVSRINVYTAAVGLTVLGAAAAMPARARPWLLGAMFAVEALVVARNAQAGIALGFP